MIFSHFYIIFIFLKNKTNKKQNKNKQKHKQTNKQPNKQTNKQTNNQFMTKITLSLDWILFIPFVSQIFNIVIQR